jgi:restriction system protein
MAVPPYQQLLQPLVKVLCTHGEEMSKQTLVHCLSAELCLSEDEIGMRLPSGLGSCLEHNIEWARSHLQMQGLVEGSLERGIRLTAKGWCFASQYHPGTFRERYCESPRLIAQEVIDSASRFLGLSETDEDVVDEAGVLQQFRHLNDDLALALIDRICRQSPEFFELLVIDLVLAMGYGKGQLNLAQHLGRSGDGGVDGVIAMDELGLELLYLQAKRYRPEIPVPVSAVRDFVGSLDAKRATRGVYFTTSFFPASAHDYVNQSSFRVVLIDGRRLAGLMMKHNIGVRVKQEIKIRRMDESYFAA